jgi:ABC-type glycerol-3-phosphate transport system permease component
MSSNIRLKIFKFIRENFVWIPLIILIIWTLLPLVWSLSASFKPALEVYDVPTTLIPKNFTFEGYVGTFNFPGFWRFFFNSVFLAVVSTIMTIIISTLAGYAFARYIFPLRNILLLAILIPRILPRAGLTVPLYQLFARVNLLDTYSVLLISYTATAVPMATWILAGFFKQVPISLEETASLDGANLFQKMWYVLLPVAWPGLIVVMVVAGVQSWNEFPFVLSFVSSSSLRTLPYQLFMLKDSLGIEDWSLLNAFTLSTILPILIIYLIFQKSIIKGLVEGSVKG